MPFQDGLDNPGSDPAEDKFNRWPFSKRLAQTIASFDTRNGAPVFGIFGRWGYGKSTVLNYVKRELSTTHSEKVMLFEFNPWLFTNQEELIAAFFFGLAERLERSLSSSVKEAGQFVQKWSSALGIFPFGSGASKFAEQLGKELSANSLSSQRERVFQMMRDAPRAVVVLIDDLDRLDRDEILTMLKLVRLNANFPRIIYVLSFDDEMVAKAVGGKYGGGPEVGRQFLEKIVQYPYALPAVGHDRLVAFVMNQAREACAGAGVELRDETWEEFRGLLDLHLSRRLNTPRQAIRYANALDFALPMLKGDANPFEQMLVEGLRVLFPELYVLVRDDVKSFTILDDSRTIRGIESEKLALYIKNAMKYNSEDEINAGTNVIKTLFKQPKRSESIARPRYFDRYFTYAVTPGDISDSELHERVQLARDDEELSTLLLQLAGCQPERLIHALYALVFAPKSNLERLERQRGVVLARAIARIGSLFVAGPMQLSRRQQRGQWMRFLQPRRPPNFKADRAEALIISLLDTSKKGYSEIVRVLELAEPPIFAFRLGLALGYQIWGEVPVKEVLAKRIKPLLGDQLMIPSSLGEVQLDLLSLWSLVDETEQLAWLNSRLVGSPTDAIPVLEYVYKNCNFDGADYGLGMWPSSFVSPAVLFEALHTVFGAELTTADSSSSQDLRRAAHFVAVFKKSSSPTLF